MPACPLYQIRWSEWVSVVTFAMAWVCALPVEVGVGRRWQWSAGLGGGPCLKPSLVPILSLSLSLSPSPSPFLLSHGLLSLFYLPSLPTFHYLLH